MFFPVYKSVAGFIKLECCSPDNSPHSSIHSTVLSAHISIVLFFQDVFGCRHFATANLTVLSNFESLANFIGIKRNKNALK